MSIATIHQKSLLTQCHIIPSFSCPMPPLTKVDCQWLYKENCLHWPNQDLWRTSIPHTMAKPPNFHLILLSLLTIHVAESTPTTTTHHHHHKNQFSHLRSLHFALFQHETINKTAFIIVDGIPGAGVVQINQTGAPFGTIFVANDQLTTTPDPTSRVAGVAEATSITSSFDGLRSVTIANVTLDVEGLKGSISILGGSHSVKPVKLPVVGGTDDFMFVQGYVRTTTVDLTGLALLYKIEFNLYWPPYATT